MPQQKTILILDVATSGYSPDNDHILEVACILASAEAPTFDVIDICNVVVRHPSGSVKAPDFHEALLAECGQEDRSSLKACEGFLLAGPWTTADVLCNRALDFDLKFLAKQMPTLHRALTKNKPQIEIKALEVLHLAGGGRPYESTVSRTFRAADDAVAAYEELQWYYGARGAAATTAVAA
jgi:oligoribonuclease (3'-5' exoribonuclease)